MYSVLFVDEANAAGSIMAEALLRALGGGRFVVASAGTDPAGSVHPLALETLARSGYDTRGLHSKSWTRFAGPGERIDFVIGLGGGALDASRWPSRPIAVRWDVADPALADDEERRRAFGAMLGVLRRRVQHLTSLPFESLDRSAVAVMLRRLYDE